MHLTPATLPQQAHPASPGLPSWTRSLPEDDVVAALSAAEPGLPLVEWRRRCEALLPHASHKRQREVLTLVLRGLLDHDSAAIADCAFSRLARELGARGQTDLVWGRYLFGLPLVDAALREVVAPVAQLLDEPLVSPDRLQITTLQWQVWLEHRLAPGASQKSAINTRGNLLSALRRVGILSQNSPGARQAMLRRASPEPRAFAWLLAHELRSAQRMEAPERWAGANSFAARLFLPSPAHVQVCVDQGVAAGFLQRSYLAGEPRLLVPAEA